MHFQETQGNTLDPLLAPNRHSGDEQKSLASCASAWLSRQCAFEQECEKLEAICRGKSERRRGNSCVKRTS